MLTRNLQVSDVGKAHPEILHAVQTMVKKGKWTVPGKFFLSCNIRILNDKFPRLQGKVW